MDEVFRMRGFAHKNVLCMLGLVMKSGKPYVILPYMENGDLKTYVSDPSRVWVFWNSIVISVTSTSKKATSTKATSNVKNMKRRPVDFLSIQVCRFGFCVFHCNDAHVSDPCYSWTVGLGLSDCKWHGIFGCTKLCSQRSGCSQLHVSNSPARFAWYCMGSWGRFPSLLLIQEQACLLLSCLKWIYSPTIFQDW